LQGHSLQQGREGLPGAIQCPGGYAVGIHLGHGLGKGTLDNLGIGKLKGGTDTLKKARFPDTAFHKDYTESGEQAFDGNHGETSPGPHIQQGAVRAAEPQNIGDQTQRINQVTFFEKGYIAFRNQADQRIPLPHEAEVGVQSFQRGVQ